MRKSILIIVGVIYIASIVVVSLFGLAAKVYGETFPVEEIVCINETTVDYQVDEDSDGNKTIYVNYTTPGNFENMSGTILLLEFKVGPTRATNKKLKFVYDRDSYPQVEFYKVKDTEKSIIAFSGPALFTLVAEATDGSGVKSKEIHISVR